MFKKKKISCLGSEFFVNLILDFFKIFHFFMVFILSVFLMASFQLYNDGVFIRNNYQIYDLFFDFLPRIESYNILNCNVQLGIYITVFVIYLIFTPNRVKISKRFLFLLSSSLIIRSFSISMTIFPVSDETCIMNNFNFVESFKNSHLRVTNSVNTCTDKIYSGHMTFCVLCLFTWVDYIKIHTFIPLFFTVFLAFSTLALRNHYSIDVFIAILVNTLIHKCYYYFSIVEKNNLIVKLIEC